MGVFLFKQKTAYEMRISDWSSDVCSSDLDGRGDDAPRFDRFCRGQGAARRADRRLGECRRDDLQPVRADAQSASFARAARRLYPQPRLRCEGVGARAGAAAQPAEVGVEQSARSEEHTSELQSLMRTSYAVFCLKKKKQKRLIQ